MLILHSNGRDLGWDKETNLCRGNLEVALHLKHWYYNTSKPLQVLQSMNQTNLSPLLLPVLSFAYVNPVLSDPNSLSLQTLAGGDRCTWSSVIFRNTLFSGNSIPLMLSPILLLIYSFIRQIDKVGRVRQTWSKNLFVTLIKQAQLFLMFCRYGTTPSEFVWGLLERREIVSFSWGPWNAGASENRNQCTCTKNPRTARRDIYNLQEPLSYTHYRAKNLSRLEANLLSLEWCFDAKVHKWQGGWKDPLKSYLFPFHIQQMIVFQNVETIQTAHTNES